jgi:threonine/homoserine/homoserine lactone efflux protein
MNLDLYFAFVAASALLILTPGPMVALIIANSVSYGLGRGLVTVAGSSAAMALHLALVCVGLASLLAGLGEALFWLKWAGAVYLLYLGLRALRGPAAPLETAAASQRKSVCRTFAEAFLVSLFNPKVLIFYAAFFPLFVSSAAPAGPQLLILSGTFLAVAMLLDAGWAVFADRARPLLGRAGRWGNRITGGVLIAAAGGLALARRS